MVERDMRERGIWNEDALDRQLETIRLSGRPLSDGKRQQRRRRRRSTKLEHESTT